MRRRELLGLLSVASGALVWLGDLDSDPLRLQAALAAPTRLDDAVLNDCGDLNLHAWRAYRSVADKATVLDNVLEHLRRLTRLARHNRTAAQHRRLCALIADVAQLAGEVQFDADRFDAAAHCYSVATGAAKEAGEYDLWACALVRQSFIAIYGEQPHLALPLLETAARLSLRGDGALTTRYWVAAVAAQAHAGMGDFAACQRALEAAEGMHASPGTTNGTWLRFDGARLPEERGACYVKLGQPDLAEPALQVALAQLPAPNRRRGLILTDLARAALLSGEVEGACVAGHEAAEIARHGHSGVLRKGLRGLQTQLAPFAHVRAVTELGQEIQALASG